MQKLFSIIGQENDLNFVAKLIKETVEEYQPPGVGALQVNCSD